MAKTKKPTGMSIARNGNKFTCSWKLPEKYSKGQKCAFQLKYNGVWGNWSKGKFVKNKWNALSCTKDTKTKTVEITLSSYYPNSGKKTLAGIRFRVCGKASKKKGWSDYTTKEFEIKKPVKVSVSQALADGTANQTVFSWSGGSSANDTHAYFTQVYWEAILLKNSSIKDGEKAFGASGIQDRQTGTGSLNSSKSITEETGIIEDGNSYTRWFRVCARGPSGRSAYAYTKHVYAAAPQAQNVEPEADLNDTGGVDCDIRFDASSSYTNPTVGYRVQYVMIVPGSGLICPSTDTWQDGPYYAYKKGQDLAKFKTNVQPGQDECMFVRVNTINQNKTTPGEAKLACIGRLKTPAITELAANDGNHRVSITAENKSSVPDSFLAVWYQGSTHERRIVGIIPAGTTGTVTIQCPDWSSQTTKTFGVQAVAGTYEYTTRNGVSTYKINPYPGKGKMESDIVWQGGSVPSAPSNVKVAATDESGTVRVNWKWSWPDADGAELSWADHADAWESTEGPSTYEIANLYSGQWNIAGLETGIRWYVRVRLYKSNEDSRVYGPYSDIKSINLASAPNVPALFLSEPVVSGDGNVTASWGYTTTDGTPQAYAEVCEATLTRNGVTYGDVIAHTTTEQHVVLYPAALGWANGSTHHLCVRVTSASGQRCDGWSAPVAVKVAEPLECRISYPSGGNLRTITITDDSTEGTTRSVLSLLDMPLTLTVTGAGEFGTTTVAIERAESRVFATPDETGDAKYEGETIALITETGTSLFIIDTEDLIGSLDDGGIYRIVATVSDEIGQRDTADPLLFEVHWSHQAIVPCADITIDPEELVAMIMPIDSENTKTWTYNDLTASEMANLNTKLGLSESTSSWDYALTYAEYKAICDILSITYETSQVWDCTTTLNERLNLKRSLQIDIIDGDTCDIYRLSADRPELIFQGAEFGTQYVDPYPAIGKFGGHRIVYRTTNGDYTTADGEIAWTDYGPEEGDVLDTGEIIIDFAEDQVFFDRSTDISYSWEKDFKATKYLGGSVRGDWNPAVIRKGTASTLSVVASDLETIRGMRRLAEHAGICHIRTSEGSSFAADVQVSDSRDLDKGHIIAAFTLSITRVDPEGYDGKTYADWLEDQEED